MNRAAYITVTVNGEHKELAGDATVAALIDLLELRGKRVAVEVNGKVVPRSRHESHILRVGDRIEVVHAIGGG